MSTISYTDTEICTIRLVSDPKSQTTWDNEGLKSIKKKIKKFHYKKQNHRCCYCREKLHEHQATYDLEHILPKSKFPKFIFTNKNISVSCKRCNSSIKRRNTDFLSATFRIQRPFKSKHYKIVHPNIDNYKTHIERKSLDTEHVEIVIYKRKTKKGEFTYQYFRLRELEVQKLHNYQKIDISSLIADLLSQP